MEWQNGYTASYYVTKVDPVTWRDIERIEIVSGQIKRENKGLRESANIKCVSYPNAVEQWLRIWMDVDQVGSNDHIALFTGLATSPSRDFSGDYESNSLECYSVLKPASDVYLLRGWYAPSGSNGANIIKELLSVIPAPVNIAEGAPVLVNNIVAENNETRLTMIEKILTSINWRMIINGDGSVNIEPKPTESKRTFDPINFDVIETELNVTEDWFNCPNVLMTIVDDLTAIARDDSEDSPLSTINRGREVWEQETNSHLSDNETIEQYAIRRLKELQQIQKKVSYNRRFVPNIYPSDQIRLHYPNQELDDVFTVISQSIDLGYAAKTNEVVSK